MRSNKVNRILFGEQVLSYDIVTIPSASPARRGQTFQTVSNAEIRLRNVERWRRNQSRYKAKRAVNHGGSELVQVVKDAIDMAQAGSLAHRGHVQGSLARADMNAAWGKVGAK